MWVWIVAAVRGVRRVCGVRREYRGAGKRYDITFRGVGCEYRVSPPALDMRYAICDMPAATPIIWAPSEAEAKCYVIT